MFAKGMMPRAHSSPALNGMARDTLMPHLELGAAGLGTAVGLG